MIIYTSVCNRETSAPNDSKGQFHKDRMLLIIDQMFRNDCYMSTSSYGRIYEVSDYFDIPYFDKLSEIKECLMKVDNLMKMQNDIKFASVSNDNSNLISRLFKIFKEYVIAKTRKSNVLSVSDLLEVLKQKLGCDLFDLVDSNTINELNNITDRIAECDAIENELQTVIELAKYNQKQIFYSSKGLINEQIPDDIFKLFNGVDLQEFRKFSTHMYWDFHGDKVEGIESKLNQIHKRIDECQMHINAGMSGVVNYKIKVYKELYKYVMFSNVVISANRKLEQIDAIRVFLRETNAIISGTAGAGMKVIDIIGGFMLNLWHSDSFDLDINENEFSNEDLISIYKLVDRLSTYRWNDFKHYHRFKAKLTASRDVIEKNNDIFTKSNYIIKYKESDSKSYDRDKLQLKSEIITLRHNLSVSSEEFMQLILNNNISLSKNEIITLRRNLSVSSNEFMQLLKKHNISLNKNEIIDLRHNLSVSSEEFMQLLLNNNISLDENSIMKRIADMGLYNGGIWSSIMSGELNCTKDQLIEIIESNKLDGCYIWSLIISDKFGFNRCEVMKIIRDGKLAGNHIWSLIMWNKLRFVEADITEIINLNILEENQVKIIMNNGKDSIMRRIADMGLYHDDVVNFIMSGEFDINKFDIMDLIWDGRLYGNNIIKLLISGKFDFTKDEIIGMIDDNMFLGSEIELIKLNMFDFTKNEIIEMIDRNMFSDGQIEILLENDYLNDEDLNASSDELDYDQDALTQCSETDLDDRKSDVESEVNTVGSSNEVFLDALLQAIDTSGMSQEELFWLFKLLMIIMKLLFNNNSNSINNN